MGRRPITLWLVGAMLALLAVGALTLFPLVASLKAKSGRIRSGMTRAEVEAILGAPNPLPELATKNEAFWDAIELYGFRYTSLHVAYDADGRVMRTEEGGFRRNPKWKFW